MGVIITGMHRSGTSAVASWVSGLGLAIGDGPEFPTDLANARGMYERQDTVSFNDRWLGTLGGTWWAPPLVREQTWRSIDPQRLELDRFELDYFGARAGTSANWYVKDPRLSLLLPLWDRLLLRRPAAIIGIRSPREVAMSLNVRNGTTLRRGLALWVRYNQELFGHLAQRPALLINFDSALTEPHSTIEAIVAFLDRVGVRTDADRVPEVLGRVEPRLRRQSGQALPGADEALARDLDDIYESLRKAHLEDVGAGVEIPMPGWALEALDELSEFWHEQLGRHLAETEIDALQRQVNETRRQLEEERRKLVSVFGSRSYRWPRKVMPQSMLNEP